MRNKLQVSTEKLREEKAKETRIQIYSKKGNTRQLLGHGLAGFGKPFQMLKCMLKNIKDIQTGSIGQSTANKTPQKADYAVS